MSGCSWLKSLLSASVDARYCKQEKTGKGNYNFFFFKVCFGRLVHIM